MPGTPVVLTGDRATHRVACLNLPTAEEAEAGMPLRGGFVAAPAPGSVVDELATAEVPA